MAETIPQGDGSRAKFALFSTTGALLVAGILACANILSHYAYSRLDLSQGRIYSLSPASKTMLGRLEDPILITCYFSPALPPQYAVVREYLESLLHEYAIYSHGKIRYNFYASDDLNAFRQKAAEEGVKPVQFNIMAGDRYEVREAFLGVVLKHLDKKEVLPFVSDTAGLEYDLSSRVKKLIRPEKKTIGWVTSNGAVQIESLSQDTKDKLEEDYVLRPVDLDAVYGDTFKALDAVLLLGPTQKLDDRAVYVLDQALLAGKPVGLALDSKQVDLRSFTGSPVETGLDGWLLHLGLSLRPNLVQDVQCQKVPIQTQQGPYAMTVISDYAPFVVATDLNPESPVTKGMDSIVFPFVAPLELSTASASGPRLSVLARSSPHSWVKPRWDRQYAMLSPFDPQAQGSDDVAGPFTLAATAQGDFKSYFPEPPKDPSAAKAAKAKTSEPKPSDMGPMLKQSQAPGRLAVVGTSKFMSQDFPNPPTNQAFFLNLADWLGQDQDLAAIRSKNVAFRPLRDIPAGWKMTVRYADMFGGPLLIVLFGVGRWRRRAFKIAAKVRLYRPGVS